MKFNRYLFVFATWMTCYTASATDISCGTGFEELGKKSNKRKQDQVQRSSKNERANKPNDKTKEISYRQIS